MSDSTLHKNDDAQSIELHFFETGFLNLTPHIADAVYKIEAIFNGLPDRSDGKRKSLDKEALVMRLVDNGMVASAARDAIQFAVVRQILRCNGTQLEETITLSQVRRGEYANWLGPRQHNDASKTAGNPPPNDKTQSERQTTIQPYRQDLLGLGTAPRNLWFVTQYEAIGTDTFHKPAVIHAMWDGMAATERAQICPDNPNKITKEAVAKAIQRTLQKHGGIKPITPRQKQKK